MQIFKKLVKYVVIILLLIELQPLEILAENIIGSEAVAGSAAGKLKSLSGYIKDAKTGEALIGATVLIKELKKGAATNAYGFYSVSLLPGAYNVDFSYMGYATESGNCSAYG